jgi:hypothetical protein
VNLEGLYNDSVQINLSAFLVIEDGSLWIGDPAFLFTGKSPAQTPSFSILRNHCSRDLFIPPGHYPIYSVYLDGAIAGMILLNNGDPKPFMPGTNLRKIMKSATQYALVKTYSGLISLSREEVLFVWRHEDMEDIKRKNTKDKAQVAEARVFGVRVINGVSFPMSDLVSVSVFGKNGTFPALVCRDEHDMFIGVVVITTLDLEKEGIE